MSPWGRNEGKEFGFGHIKFELPIQPHNGGFEAIGEIRSSRAFLSMENRFKHGAPGHSNISRSGKKEKLAKQKELLLSKQNQEAQGSKEGMGKRLFSPRQVMTTGPVEPGVRK